MLSSVTDPVLKHLFSYFDYLLQPISLVVSFLICKVFVLLGSHMHECGRLRAAHHSVFPFILDKIENPSAPNGTFLISLFPTTVQDSVQMQGNSRDPQKLITGGAWKKISEFMF